MNFQFIKHRSITCGPECGSSCEHNASKVLGSSSSVRNFANFWATNASEMSVLFSWLITEEASKGDFTPAEFAQYRKGLLDFVNFFQTCLEENEKKPLL